MNRRGFLKFLGLAAPAAVVAPKYFFAPIGGWKSDVITNPTTYICGKDAAIGQYADYMNWQVVRVKTAIDPALTNLSNELGYRLTLTIKSLQDARAIGKRFA